MNISECNVQRIAGSKSRGVQEGCLPRPLYELLLTVKGSLIMIWRHHGFICLRKIFWKEFYPVLSDISYLDHFSIYVHWYAHPFQIKKVTIERASLLLERNVNMGNLKDCIAKFINLYDLVIGYCPFDIEKCPIVVGNFVPEVLDLNFKGAPLLLFFPHWSSCGLPKSNFSK